MRKKMLFAALVMMGLIAGCSSTGKSEEERAKELSAHPPAAAPVEEAATAPTAPTTPTPAPPLTAGVRTAPKPELWKEIPGAPALANEGSDQRGRIATEDVNPVTAAWGKA